MNANIESGGLAKFSFFGEPLLPSRKAGFLPPRLLFPQQGEGQNTAHAAWLLPDRGRARSRACDRDVAGVATFGPRGRVVVVGAVESVVGRLPPQGVGQRRRGHNAAHATGLLRGRGHARR